MPAQLTAALEIVIACFGTNTMQINTTRKLTMRIVLQLRKCFEVTRLLGVTAVMRFSAARLAHNGSWIVRGCNAMES